MFTPSKAGIEVPIFIPVSGRFLANYSCKWSNPAANAQRPIAKRQA
jgi:hypothetical protein